MGSIVHKISRADSYLPGQPRDLCERKVIAADPMAVLAPGMHWSDAKLLTRSPPRSLASHADLAPSAPRPGQDTNLGHPSRIGDRLHYRDGSITGMDGQAIASPAPQSYKPLTRILK